jgi:hypothetical protein
VAINKKRQIPPTRLVDFAKKAAVEVLNVGEVPGKLRGEAGSEPEYETAAVAEQTGTATG